MNIPESNLRNMLNSISELNHVLNETITLYKNVAEDCPSCSYDPIRGESTDPHCDECDGVGKIITSQTFTIPSSVETEEDFAFEYKSVGRLSTGEILSTIDKKEITEVLNVDGTYDMDNQKDIKRFLDQFEYFEWKGAEYTLVKFQAGYLQGNFYEISLTLKLRA